MTQRPAPLRVAAAQAVSVPGDLRANVATAVQLVGAAADRGVALVVLPELFLTGYSPDGWRPEACLALDEPELEPLRDTARNRGVVVLAGAAVRRDPAGSGRPAACTVSLVMVGRDGTVSAPYDKQHLFAAERDFFTAGDHGATVVVDGWELGLGVCYDGCFPEHAAAAAAAGAIAYVCPSAYFAGSEHRRDLYYAARALDNGIYVVMAGLTGTCGPWEFSGGSAVYDPEGRPQARVGAEAPALAVADLDAAEVERVQEMNPIARDRLDSPGRRHRVVVGA